MTFKYPLGFKLLTLVLLIFSVLCMVLLTGRQRLISFIVSLPMAVFSAITFYFFSQEFQIEDTGIIKKSLTKHEEYYDFEKLIGWEYMHDSSKFIFYFKNKKLTFHSMKYVPGMKKFCLDFIEKYYPILTDRVEKTIISDGLEVKNGNKKFIFSKDSLAIQTPQKEEFHVWRDFRKYEYRAVAINSVIYLSLQLITKEGIKIPLNMITLKKHMGITEFVAKKMIDNNITVKHLHP